MFYWIREQSQNALHAAVGGHDPKHWHGVIHTLESLTCLLAEFCPMLTSIIPVIALNSGELELARDH